MNEDAMTPRKDKKICCLFRPWRLGVLAFIISALSSSVGFAQEKITYQDHVRPILSASCARCHNPDKNTAGLNLTSYGGAIAGSSNGKVLVPGDADASRLYLS